MAQILDARDKLIQSEFLLSNEGKFFYGGMTMLKVKNVPLESIKPYENNPRRVSEEAVNALTASIKEFGFRGPVILDRENVIVAGHTRVLAAQKLGLAEIPCIVADDLTPEQIKAFRLVDNKTAELTGWDFEKLDMELEELSLDMSDFGFDVSGEDIDTGAFFTEAESVQQPEKKTSSRVITCPACGAEIRV